MYKLLKTDNIKTIQTDVIKKILILVEKNKTMTYILNKEGIIKY